MGYKGQRVKDWQRRRLRNQKEHTEDNKQLLQQAKNQKHQVRQQQKRGQKEDRQNNSSKIRKERKKGKTRDETARGYLDNWTGVDQMEIDRSR